VNICTHVPTWTRILGSCNLVSQRICLGAQLTAERHVSESLQCLERAATPATSGDASPSVDWGTGGPARTHRGAPRRGHRGPVPATAPHVIRETDCGGIETDCGETDCEALRLVHHTFLTSADAIAACCQHGPWPIRAPIDECMCLRRPWDQTLCSIPEWRAFYTNYQEPGRCGLCASCGADIKNVLCFSNSARPLRTPRRRPQWPVAT
jgi:hypothetical protein